MKLQNEIYKRIPTQFVIDAMNGNIEQFVEYINTNEIVAIDLSALFYQYPSKFRGKHKPRELNYSHDTMNFANLSCALQRTPCVRAIDLSHNDIDCEQANSFAQNINSTNLEKIIMTDNAIRFDGIYAFIKLLIDTKISSLDCQGNFILAEDEQLSELAKLIAKSNLEEYALCKPSDINNLLDSHASDKEESEETLTKYVDHYSLHPSADLLCLHLTNFNDDFDGKMLEATHFPSESEKENQVRYATGIIRRLPLELASKVASYLLPNKFYRANENIIYNFLDFFSRNFEEGIPPSYFINSKVKYPHIQINENNAISIYQPAFLQSSALKRKREETSYSVDDSAPSSASSSSLTLPSRLMPSRSSTPHPKGPK